jgi:hypothetical protein
MLGLSLRGTRFLCVQISKVVLDPTKYSVAILEFPVITFNAFLKHLKQVHFCLLASVALDK